MAGIVTIAFGGWPLLFALNILITRKPVIAITKEGFFDHSTVIDVSLVRWKDIKDVTISSGSIRIYTYDPDLIIHRTRGIKSWLHSANKKLKSAQVNVIIDGSSYSIDDLKNEVFSHWNRKSKDAT